MSRSTEGDLRQFLFSPRSVAIIGQSDDATKTAGRPLKFLRRMGYAGRIYPVNSRRETALAEHGFAPRIDRIDAARIAHPPQKFQRPPGGFGRIVRLSDDGDGAGREEELGQIAFRRARHELEQSK